MVPYPILQARYLVAEEFADRVNRDEIMAGRYDDTDEVQAALLAVVKIERARVALRCSIAIRRMLGS